MHLQVSQSLAPAPPGRILTSYPVLRGNPRETRRDSSLHDPQHKDEHPPFSPTQDLDTKEGEWVPGQSGPCPLRVPQPTGTARTPRPWPRVAGTARPHGLGAAPMGRVDICNQHAGSGKGRAARPGGKLTLTLSLIKQNNQAARWSGDVAAAGGAGLGAVRDRHPPPPPRRDEPRAAGQSPARLGKPRADGRPGFPADTAGQGREAAFSFAFCPSLYKKTRGAQHDGGGPRVSLARCGAGGGPGAPRRGGEARDAPRGGFR